MDVKQFLDEKFDRIESEGDNWKTNCPFCDDDRKRFGVHKEKGLWHCFNCNISGKSIYSLQKKLSTEVKQDLDFPESKRVRDQSKKDKPEQYVKIPQNLAAKHQEKLKIKDRKAADYLRNERGFSDETISYFQLGSWKTKGFEYVSLPFWKRGKLVNIKYRAVDFQDRKFKWRRIKGGESSLFHDDVIDHDHNYIFVTEAELDAVALWNAGFKNVVAVTTGAKSFKQEWYERLERFKRIYLVYDNDVDGQSGAEKVAQRLGMDRCYNILLPKIQDEKKTDANNYFWDTKKRTQRYSAANFRKLIKEARKFEVKDVVSLRDAIKDAYKSRFVADEDEIMGFPTPWPKINGLLKKGNRPGHLVVVSGISKIGKTTWVQNWIRALGNDQKVTSLIYECEMKPDQLGEKFVAMETVTLDMKEDFEAEDFSWAAYKLPIDKIYIAHPRSEAPTLDGACDTIRAAVQRYGARVVVFDNLHFLVRSDNVKDEIGRVTRTFKLLAENLNVLFILIVHPKKTGQKEPTPDDLKDSSSIFQDLDTLILLHRNYISSGKEGTEDEGTGGYEPLTKVLVQGRWCAGGFTFQYFDGSRSLFYEKGDLLRNALAKRKALSMKKVGGFNVKGQRGN